MKKRNERAPLLSTRTGFWMVLMKNWTFSIKFWLKVIKKAVSKNTFQMLCLNLRVSEPLGSWDRVPLFAQRDSAPWGLTHQL